MGGKHHLLRSKSDPGKGRHQLSRHSRSQRAASRVLKVNSSITGSNKSHQQVLSDRSLRSSKATKSPSSSSSFSKNQRISGENLSFCGCGFLGIYHVGVASSFHAYAPQLSMHKIAGSSAGALVAVAHICGNPQLARATTDILRVAIDARARTLGPFHPSFDINAIVRDALERGLPDDVHLRTSGKLHISLTRLYDGENVIISKFDSKEDIIQALICSCFIPFWSGLVAPKYKGVTYIDGGFSNNLLILDDKTVTVSPFAGEADICPQDNDVQNLMSVSLSNTPFSVTPHNLYRLSHALLPPPPEVLSDLCEQGFADGIRFLQRMNLISCTKCLEIRSSSSLLAGSDELTTTAMYEQGFLQDSMRPLDTRSLYDYDDGTIIEADDDSDDCDGCVFRRDEALRDSLPKQLSDRIREACDNVNKSLYNWFYSHRPVKYLSYLAAPYYLPMNISLALFLKYWQQLPALGAELMKTIYDLKGILIDILKGLHEKSTTSKLMSPYSMWRDEDVGDTNQKHLLTQKSGTESSISVKITADCRKSGIMSLTTYECCLTIVLFGRDLTSLTSKCI